MGKFELLFGCAIFCLAFAMLSVEAFAQPITQAQMQAAQLQADLNLAQATMGKAVLPLEATIDANTKSTLSAIYDRQQSATQGGLTKLKTSTTQKPGADEINNASKELNTYMTANAAVNTALQKRVKIVNNEIAMIAKTPNNYVTALSNVGVAGSALTQMTTIVNNAAAKSGGQVNSTTTPDLISASGQIRGMLSAKQAGKLDAAMGG